MPILTDSPASNPDPLPVTLVIDCGHVVFTLYGTATAADKAYYAAVMTGLVEYLKGQQHGTQ